MDAVQSSMTANCVLILKPKGIVVKRTDLTWCTARCMTGQSHHWKMFDTAVYYPDPQPQRAKESTILFAKCVCCDAVHSWKFATSVVVRRWSSWGICNIRGCWPEWPGREFCRFHSWKRLLDSELSPINLTLFNVLRECTVELLWLLTGLNDPPGQTRACEHPNTSGRVQQAPND